MSGIYRSEAGARLLRERYVKSLEPWPVDNEQFRVPTPEGETFAIACGSPTADPLVLLHGSGSNSAQWTDTIPYLATHFRVYAIDVIGEPGFSARSRPSLKSDKYVVWLDAVLDFLDLEQVSIMAMSLGGWLALDYATRRPGRVRRLALSCPGGVGKQRKLSLLKAILLNPLGAWGRRRSVTGMLGPGLSTMEPADVDAVIEHVLLVSKNYRYRMDVLPVFEDDVLRRLTMPVHVLAGQRDAMFDSAETKRRLEIAAPQATVRLLPDVGHFIPTQAAELDFLVGTRQGEQRA